MTYPYSLLDDVDTLASFKGWSREVYEDFFRLRAGDMSEEDFRGKYCRQRAILAIDMTGFTLSAFEVGELISLTRILDVQRAVLPVLQDHGADLIRCFADDIVALFRDPGTAIDATLEIHRRIQQFNASPLASAHPAVCCAGVGFGSVFAIGPNLAQGDEMNRASKLGEDIARGNETLITERVYAAVASRDDLAFERQEQDDSLFPFYRVTEIE
jgi:class 3 adenylate cyclase